MKIGDFGKMTRPIRRRLGALLMRGTVLDVESGGARVRVKVSLRAGEVADFLDLFEPFGFTAPPLPDRDGVVTVAFGGQGSNRIAFNAGGRYHRPTDLAPGESCVYNQYGDRITLRNDRSINVEAAESVNVTTKVATVNASESTTVTSPIVAIHAATSATITSASITLDAPFVHCTNALQVDGNINGRAMVRDQVGTMQSIRVTYNGHNHPENDNGGPTDTPNQRM